MSSRTRKELTPAARIAAVARELMMREAKCSSCNRVAAPSKPDYADFRTELDPYLKVEILKALLEEARLCENQDRVRILNAQLIAAYMEIQ